MDNPLWYQRHGKMKPEKVAKMYMAKASPSREEMKNWAYLAYQAAICGQDRKLERAAWDQFRSHIPTVDKKYRVE